MLRPHIFTRAIEIDQALLAHTPTGTGDPQFFLIVKTKKWLKIQRIHVKKFGTNGDTMINFYPDDVPRASGYNLGTICGRPAP